MLNRWQRTIVDLRGNVVPYAQLQIRVESTQATATIYADKDGREPIPNGIVTADANGYAYFYAEADLYRISSMKPTIDWRHVDIGSANAVRVATEALNENLVTYPTLAGLQADKSRDENSMGRVVNDGENNGYYLWNGTSWVRTSYQPMQRDEFDDFVLHTDDEFLHKDAATIDPEPGKLPVAGSDGKINSGWIDFENEDLDKVIEKKIFERGVGASDAIGVALVAREGNGGELVHVNNQLQVIDVQDGFFDKHDVFSGIEHVVIDGQDMIRIPKFYVKSVDTYIQGYDDLCPVWLVSSSKGVGYQTHPAFMNNGEEIDQIYIGKYQASLGDDGLRSVPGVLPSINRSIAQFKSDAEKRNTGGVDGFMLWSVWQWSAIQVLYLIENATFNSQAKTGNGRVSASSAAEVDAEDVAQATYRGMVGLWGNVNQWLDGLTWQGHTFRVWDQSGNKTLIDTGVTRGDAGAAVYPDYLYRGIHGGVDMSLLFIGESGKSSNSNATIPDSQYLHANTGTYFPHVGGAWSNGSNAGLWRLGVGSSSASARSYIGGRLAKI